MLGYLGRVVQCWLPGLAPVAMAPPPAIPSPQVVYWASSNYSSMTDALATKRGRTNAREQVARCPANADNGCPSHSHGNHAGHGFAALAAPWHIVGNVLKHTVHMEDQAAFTFTVRQLVLSTYAHIITVALSRALETPELLHRDIHGRHHRHPALQPGASGAQHPSAQICSHGSRLQSPCYWWQCNRVSGIQAKVSNTSSCQPLPLEWACTFAWLTSP